VYRKGKREIQDSVYGTLLPRAFTCLRRIYANISRREKLLVVDAACAPKAEEFLNLLRDTLGSFPVALPVSKIAPGSVMTRWLKQGKASDSFVVNDDCEWISPKDASNVVRLKGQDLEGDEIQAHLDAGKQARHLAVVWDNRVSGNIVEDLNFKRQQFENMREESGSFDKETPA